MMFVQRCAMSHHLVTDVQLFHAHKYQKVILNFGLWIGSLCVMTYCRNVMIHMTPTHLKCICGLQKCKIPTIHSQHLDCLLNVTIIF